MSNTEVKQSTPIKYIKMSDLPYLSNYISDMFEMLLKKHTTINPVKIDTICCENWKKDELTRKLYRENKKWTNIDGTFTNMNTIKPKEENVLRFVVEAVKNLKDRTGSSIQAIIKYIKSRHDEIDEGTIINSISEAVRKGYLNVHRYHKRSFVLGKKPLI